jgi:hypothetical protein
MARLARIVVAGPPHHVTQHGNRREAIFFEDGDHETSAVAKATRWICFEQKICIMSPDYPGVDEVGVTPLGFAHGAAKVVCLRRFQDQVHVVRHQAIGPNRDAGFQRLLGEKIEIDFVIAILEEDGFATE